MNESKMLLLMQLMEMPSEVIAAVKKNVLDRCEPHPGKDISDDNWPKFITNDDIVNVVAVALNAKVDTKTTKAAK